MNVEVRLGLPEHQRAAAARLYWQAFGGKLGTVMGPTTKALTFLERVMRPDQAIVAVDGDGTLQGIAGFKTMEGSFSAGDMTDMRAIYGPAGAVWRGSLMRLLAREVDNERFLVDGICVAPAARSRGVGSALLGAICEEARNRGYPAVRLDVIDTNWRAKALYLRQGFVVEKTENLGILSHFFGFASSTTMIRPLA